VSGESLRAELAPDEVELLEALGPGIRRLDALRTAYLAGELGGARNRVRGSVAPVDASHIVDLRGALAHSSGLDAALVDVGTAAMRADQVGLVVLNGGMATRFGGVVKGVLPVNDSLSFLGLKLADALRVALHAGAKPPVVLLMNSRATTGPTLAHLEANDYFGYPPERVWMFEQQWSVRLATSGGIYREASGAASFYGPGHGDLVECIGRSGLLKRFIDAGGRTLLMSNVDNVPATLDLRLLGQHLEAGVDASVELVDKRPGDAGGAPALVDGQPQILEAFRLPETFDPARLPVFNTNTLWLQASALERAHPLTWFAVEKRVDDQTVIQFERLIGELTAFVSTQWLRVSREGPETRFVPVKHPDDLGAQRDELLSAWYAHAPST